MELTKKIFSAVVAAGITVSSMTMLWNDSSNVSAADTVVISPYSTYEINNGVFEGWGTSLCWWANRIGYSDSLSEQAAELFFGDSGLRMNIARFNIGGGDNPTHKHITRTDSNMPGYTVYNNGNVTYDWNADYNQRNVLFKAIEASGNELIVEMFSNSPPYYMTKSGCSSGSNDASSNNLKDDCYDDFAEYFAEVCEHYEKEWGVDIQSATPLNEPYTNFWKANSYKQEGCHFDIGESESKIITELQKSLKSRGLDDIILSGTDETSIDTQIDAFNKLSADAKKAVSRIDTHTYGGSKRNQLKNLAVANNKNLWMSEVDGGSVAGSNAGQMGAALWLAERMTIDCNGLNSSAWILWQAIDNHISSKGYNGNKDSGMPNINNGFWGLAVADHDNNNIILTKKYYAFGQFSRYIRPGYIMLKSSNSTLAAYDTENDRLVIVATNTSGSADETYFDLSQFSSVGDKAQVIRTSGDVNTGENWKELSPVPVGSDGFNVSLAPNSVTTFIVDNVVASSVGLTEIPVSESMIKGSAAWNNSTNDCKKVIDGDFNTYFDGVENGYVEIDLGSGYDLTAISYAPRSGYEYRCVDGYVSVSSDGENWTKVHTIKSQPFIGLNYITSLAENRNIRYIRYQTPSGAPQNSYNKDNVYCCNLAELKVYGTESNADPKINITKEMATGSAAWNNGANDYTKVFDGDPATYFDGVGNGYVQIDMGKMYELTSIGYIPRNGYEYRCVDAVISGSVDGESWKELAIIGKQPSFAMNYISLPENTNVRYIRYQVPTGTPQNSYNKDDVYCCNLAEIALYGKEGEQVQQPQGISGDANCDGAVTMADAAAVYQALGNPDKYALSAEGTKNADCSNPGNGITAADAIAIQKLSANVIDKLPVTE